MYWTGKDVRRFRDRHVNFDDVCDELYGLDPSDFVKARTAHARAAREQGDRPLAAAIASLRRPTTVGWLINLLARERPDEIAELLSLGHALREAQRRLAGADLRRLTARRQQVVRALAARCGELAAPHGRTVGEDALRDVTQTLNAALADEETAELVRQGRVVTAASYNGFGPSGLAVVADAPADRSGPQPTAPPEETAPDPALVREAKAALAVADAEVDEQRRALDDLASTLGRTRAALTDLDHRIEDLRAELEHAEQERHFTKNTEKTTAASVRRLEQQLRTAETRLDQARRDIERLG